MWIEGRADDAQSRIALVCDGCSTVFPFERTRRSDRKAVWHRANIAGWARIARLPDRHLCTTC
jgi:hypothetical protein